MLVKGTKQPTGRAGRVGRVERSVPSTSHEFKKLSWWSAWAAGATDVEMVAEEAGHQPVWGLRPGSRAVRATLAVSKQEAPATVTAAAEVAPPGVVGTEMAPERLVLLTLSLPRSVPWERFVAHVDEAYARHFADANLPIYYTRKFYEDVTWKLFGTVPRRSMASVRLQGGVAEELLADARRFLAAEAEYTRLGRPYKRVYCLHGPPGTGKTSVIMAIASALGRPLAIFNVDSLRDDTFLELLSERPANSVLLFEDVDAMFKGGDGVGGGKRAAAPHNPREAASGMTFSTLLNALDGVLHPRGALVFLTTNHLERLDAALRRPGRVDRMVLVPALSAEQAREIWRTFFPPPAPPLDADVARSLARARVSPAALSQELFVHRDAGKNAYAEAASAIRALMGGHHAPSTSGRRGGVRQ
jgi:ATPase family associated with various cellular activities (AAA)